MPGLKANMTDVQATIGRAQIRSLPGWQQARAELVAGYDEALAAAKEGGISLPWLD